MLDTSGEFCFVYATFPDSEAAQLVARHLIEEKLAACVNIHPPMTSVYRWEGKIEETVEIAAFIKTRRALADTVIAAARKLHPYTVPCFLVLPIEAGNPDYLAWARLETERPITV